MMHCTDLKWTKIKLLFLYVWGVGIGVPKESDIYALFYTILD